MNRTLIEKTKALLVDTKTDKNLWGEAVRTAAYLTNRSPTNAVQGTPFENWTSQRPNLSRLHIFGCNAYARTLTSLKKLDDRCKKYIFVGYAPNGYRLYDKERRKIKFSRDVTFAEEDKLDNETVKLKTNIEEEKQNKGETENNLEIIYESEEDSTGQYQDAIVESQSEEEEIQEEQETQEELGRGKRIKKIPSELKTMYF